jgi:hypothetical protein
MAATKRIEWKPGSTGLTATGQLGQGHALAVTPLKWKPYLAGDWKP